MSMGSVPEVIDHGQTGFVCHSVEECIAALNQVAQLDRQACREHVLAKFSVEQMVNGYEAVYEQILAQRFVRNGHVKTLV